MRGEQHNTTIEATGDFLSDFFNGTVELEEACLIAKGIVTNKWKFENSAHIELPTSCPISWEEIKCGALKLTSGEEKLMEVGPVWMSAIKWNDAEEKNLRISGEEFRGNITR